MKVFDGLAQKTLIIAYGILLIMMILPCLLGFVYPDIWWQLKEGLHILYHLKLPQTPLHAFAFPNDPFPREYVFYEVLIASIRRVLGFSGLRIFFFALAFFPFAYSFFWISEKKQWNFANFYLLLFIYFLFLLRIQQRPELLSNLFFIFILHMLAARDFRASPFFIIMLLWVNTHASFILGLGAIALFVLNDLWLYRQKNIFDLVKISFAALAGSVLHPSGPAYLLEPLKLQSAVWPKYTSVEMLPVTGWGYFFIITALILALVIVFKTGWKEKLWLVAMFAGTTFLSFQSQRYINLIGCLLCALVFINVQSEQKFEKTFKILDGIFVSLIAIPSLILLAVFFIPMLSHNFLKNDYTQRFAAPILNFLPDDNKKILTEIRAGAYINGTTENLRPFLDTGFNRFSQDNLRYYYYLNEIPEALYHALDHLQVDYVIVTKFNHYWNFVLSLHPKWKLACVEQQSVLYVKQESPETETEPYLVLWDFKAMQFYKPQRLFAQETFRLINHTPFEREGRFYSFFDWWLKRQSPKVVETFLKDNAHIEPIFNLILLENIKKLELSKFSEKKYLANDRFSFLVRAQIFAQHENMESARQEIQDFYRSFPKSSWEAEIFKKIHPSLKLDHLLWNEENQKWFSDFTQKLNER